MSAEEVMDAAAHDVGVSVVKQRGAVLELELLVDET